MVSFGGLSFLNNNSVNDFLESIKPEFLKLVTMHSVILTSFEDKENEVLDIAKYYSYPRIGTYLAAAKSCDDKFLFSDSNEPSNLNLLYENVLNLMVNSKSPFAEGITAIAAGFTAIKLMRRLPINNDLKNLDSALHYEKRYVEELDKIISLYCKTTDSKSNSLIENKSEINQSFNSFYLAFNLDKNTIPSNLFDTGEIAEILELNNQTVKTYESLKVESDYYAFAYIYLSSIEDNIVSKKAKSTTLKLLNGFSLNSIIDKLAITINQLTLNNNEEIDSNLIVSPNLTKYEFKDIQIIKKNLYPEISNSYDAKIIKFNLLNQLAYLKFDARRLSSIVNRELIIIDFQQIEKKVLIKNILNSNNTFEYKGEWRENQNYQINDLVDYNGEIYYAINENLNSLPSNSDWQIVTITSNNLIDNKDLAKPLTSLIWGSYPDYNFLDFFGPKSTIIDVEKGSVNKVSTSTSSVANTEDLCIKYPPDTFYFKFSEGVSFISGDLKLSLSSINLKKIPELESYLDLNGYLTLNFKEVYSVSTIILELNKLLFKISIHTGILAPIVKNSAIQFIPFQAAKSYQHIIDIIKLPAGLEIARGNIYKTCSEFYSLPQSLVLKVLKTKEEESQIEIKTLNNSNKLNSSEYKKSNNAFIIVKEKINLIQ